MGIVATVLFNNECLGKKELDTYCRCNDGHPSSRNLDSELRALTGACVTMGGAKKGCEGLESGVGRVRNGGSSCWSGEL